MIKREDYEGVSEFFSTLSLRIRRAEEMIIEGPWKAEFVTIYFPILWFFAITQQKLGKVWFYLAVFNCWSWRLKILAIFLVGDSFGIWESWFARLTKYEADIVSYSIRALFTKERPWLINIELLIKSTQVESTSEGKPEFSVKLIWSWL